MQAGENGGPARILLDGEITQEGWGFPEDVNAQAFCRELDRYGDVEVLINSPGGDVFAGLLIYNLLKAHKGRVTVKVAGLAASIASVIAMAGDEILMAPSSCMMIHQPWTRTTGNARDMEKTAEMLDEISHGLMDAYARKTGKDEAEIRTLMDQETWMSAQSAVEMGFADGLWEEGREEFRPRASLTHGSRCPDLDVLMARAREWNQTEDAKTGAKPQTHADLSLKRQRLKLAADALNLMMMD